MDPIRCILVSTCTLSVLMLLYHFMIRHQTALRIRRISLLFILLASLSLPFIQIESNVDSLFGVHTELREHYVLTEADMLQESIRHSTLKEEFKAPMTIQASEKSKQVESTNFIFPSWWMILYLIQVALNKNEVYQ